MTTERETLLVDKKDGVAWVSLNRPDVRNAINQQMQTELHELWQCRSPRRFAPSASVIH